MAKSIKVEWTGKDIAEMAIAELGERVSKAEAQRIIGQIKREAEDDIAEVGSRLVVGWIAAAIRRIRRR